MEKKRLILWIAVILTLAFIFGQSLLGQEVSDKESITINNRVVEPVQKVFAGETAKKLTNDELRNIAHIFEFSVLGLEFLIIFKKKNLFFCCVKALSYSGFIALIDESIQYFSGRGPQVIDIWFDILGATLGSVIGMVLISIIKKTDNQR